MLGGAAIEREGGGGRWEREGEREGGRKMEEEGGRDE